MHSLGITAGYADDHHLTAGYEGCVLEKTMKALILVAAFILPSIGSAIQLGLDNGHTEDLG